MKIHIVRSFTSHYEKLMASGVVKRKFEKLRRFGCFVFVFLTSL